MQQITADLYGIFLVIFSSPFGTEDITNVQIRGSYNAPHRFIRYRGGNTYWPLIPRVGRPSEYRFPKVTLQDTKGQCGIDDDLNPKTNDGLLHPWRRPFPDTPVPDKLSPVPITVLGPIRQDVLQTVLWATIEDTSEKSKNGEKSKTSKTNENSKTSENGKTSKKSKTSESGEKSKTSENSKTSKTGASKDTTSLIGEVSATNFQASTATSEPNPNPDTNTSKCLCHTSIDYFHMSLEDLEFAAQELAIDVSSLSTLENAAVRKERIASLVDAWESARKAEKEEMQRLSKRLCRNMMAEAKKKNLEGRFVDGIVPLRSLRNTKSGYPENPRTRLEEMKYNNDGYIRRVLRGVNIEPNKCKKKSIDEYRVWAEKEMKLWDNKMKEDTAS